LRSIDKPVPSIDKKARDDRSQIRSYLANRRISGSWPQFQLPATASSRRSCFPFSRFPWMQARSEIRRRTQGTYLRLSLRELPPIYGRFRQNLRRAGRRAGPRRPPVPPGRRPGSAARGGTQARGPQTAPAPGRRPGNRALSSAGTDRF